MATVDMTLGATLEDDIDGCPEKEVTALLDLFEEDATWPLPRDSAENLRFLALLDESDELSWLEGGFARFELPATLVAPMPPLTSPTAMLSSASSSSVGGSTVGSRLEGW